MPPLNFSAFLQTPSLPVLITELASVIGQYVLAFKKPGQAFVPVILTDVGFNRNVYIRRDGHWMSRYLPFCLRNYPFCFAANDAGERFLGIASDRLATEEHEGALPLFKADGSLSESVQKHRANIEKLEELYRLNLQKIQVLADEGLIVEWPLKVRLEKDKDPIAVEGLYRIDPEKLLALGGDKLELLKNHGVLTFALSQPMSMQHTSILMERAAHLIQQESRSKTVAAPEPRKPSFDLSNDDMIVF